jgi:hypothetical protein
MLVNIYKIWLDDVHFGALASMGQFMEIEDALMEENTDLIEKVGLLEMESG